ncbi:hypothetical protein BIV60_02370 [Bacillus sp. MUM 116]|uniref:hypothetical protein n=1 Tax=Bacillus sp. MUM 116 TaxID=1678002 RepID=UPI0008F5870E|nr:hypothetical protein [Bacillus sp. MUM 116]OIK16877.1 hypothetical protein BIV60_02370 [Bacillus sp. MUM 116]
MLRKLIRVLPFPVMALALVFSLAFDFEGKANAASPTSSLVLSKQVFAESHPAWQALHGLTAEQYQRTFNELVKKGYRLIDVSSYTIGGKDRYAAIWEKRNGPAWQARHGLTAEQYQRTFNELVKKGYRLIHINVHTNGSGKDRYAAIWVKQKGPAWQARHGLTAEQYQRTFNELVKKGYRLIHINVHTNGSGKDRYAAIWVKQKGPAWQARHGLTAEQLQRTFNELVKKGYRLIDVSSYTIGGKDRYAAIWVKQKGPAWQARHGLTAEQYQRTFNELVKKGYRLIHINVHTNNGKDRYAAIWVK